MKLFQKLLISSLAGTLSLPVLADNTLKITVTGTRNPRPVDTFPGSVDIFTKDDLDDKTGFTLRDLTDKIPGVTTEAQKRTGVKGTPNGGNNLNIRGLERNRVLFLIDGIRLPSYYYGSSGSAPYYNMNQGNYVDFGSLKGIEILKGPASALYGADALGGVVSYKSLKARDLLKPGDAFKIFSKSSYDSSVSGITQTVQIANELSDTFSSLAVFTIEDSKETQVQAADNFIDDEIKTGKNYYLSLTKDFDNYSYIDLVYEQVNRKSDIAASQGSLDAMAGPLYSPLITNVYTDHDSFMKTRRDRISLEYNYENPDNDKLFKSINSKVYSQYSRKDDDMTRSNQYIYSPFWPVPTLAGQTVDQGQSVRKYYLKNDIYGIDLAFTSQSDFANTEHLFTYGIDYNITETRRLRNTDGTLAKDNPDTQITRSGAFIQDEFTYGKFDFIAGLRFDDYELDSKTDSVYTLTEFAADLSEDSLSPKFAATYNFSSNLSGFAQYAQGFRAPAWYEVNSSFKNTRGGYTTESNPSLKPETSDTYEIGLRARYPKFDLNLFGFLSKYDNFIEQLKKVELAADRTDGLDLYKSINADKAEIKGLEFSGEYFLKPTRSGFSLFSLIALQEGTNTTDNLPLKTISPFEARLGIKFKSNDNKWKAELSNKFVGSPRVKTDETDFIPEEYSVTDLTAAYFPNDRFELNAGIYNLFDATYYNYQDVRSKSSTLSNITAYTQPGRYVQVGFGLKF